MYTKADYMDDLYIAEHGSGAEQVYAKMRARNYELGGDPANISYIGSEAYIRERKGRKIEIKNPILKAVIGIIKVAIVLIVIEFMLSIILSIFV